MSLRELEAKYKELGEEIERIKADSAWPKSGDTYWVIGVRGQVFQGLCRNDSYDVDCVAIGNIFRTKEEVISEVESRKVIAELRRQPGIKKFVIEEYNFCLRIDFWSGTISTDHWYSIDQGWQSVYFESAEAVLAAIKAVGKERIIKAAKWWAQGEIWE